MKLFIIGVHVLLGLVVVFLGGNNLLHLATLNPDQYYYGISLAQGYIEVIALVILGLLSLIGALAFKKDKRWASVILPIVTLLISIDAFRSLMLASGFVGG